MTGEKLPVGNMDVLRATTTGKNRNAVDALNGLFHKMKDSAVDRKKLQAEVDDLKDGEKALGVSIRLKLDKLGLRGVKLDNVGSVAIRNYGGKETITKDRLCSVMLELGIEPETQRKILDKAVKRGEDNYCAVFTPRG